MTEETTYESEVHSRTPRKERNRVAIEAQKKLRKKERDRAASQELHARIRGILQVLVGRGDIKDFIEMGKRPESLLLTMVFRVMRPGKKEPITRDFVATYDPRLCQMVQMEAPCAAIVVTREMRTERIEDHILELFKN